MTRARPRLTAAVMRALGAVRASASIELDSGDAEDYPEHRDGLRRGIRYLDDLRDWYDETHKAGTAGEGE